MDANILLQDDQGNYTETLRTTVGGTCETEYVNRDDFVEKAIFKCSIATNDETQQERWNESLEKATDQKTYAYLAVDAHTDNPSKRSYIKYQGNRSDMEYKGVTMQNVFLDEAGSWLEVKKGCDCGENLNLKFHCVKYSGSGPIQYGPVYYGVTEIDAYSGWNNLIAQNKINSEEKEIIIAVTKNEGKLDSVQSYDSEIFLSRFGAENAQLI